MRRWNAVKGLWSALVISAALLLATAPLARAGQIEVDPALAGYAKVQGVSGNLNSIGSDTLNNLMTFWAEGFRKKYPSVNIQIEGKGSGTAPPALIAGTAQLAPMSRPMKKGELEAFETKFGFKPTAIGVALDSLAVFVNKDNPLQALSLPQLDAIFSKTRKSGAAEISTWGEAGLKGSWASLPVSLYGRNSASGTYGYFKDHALFKGDFKDIVKEQPGSSAVVQAVTEEKAGIGYSGIGYRTSGVKAIALAKKDGEPAYEPSYENVLDGKYPLGRMLFIYVAKKPNEKLPALTEEFLRYVLSSEGQEIVVKDGYLPLPAQVAAKALGAIQ